MEDKDYEDTKMKMIVPVIMLGTKNADGRPNYMICAGRLDGISGAYMAIHKATFNDSLNFGQKIENIEAEVDSSELLSVINFTTIESVNRMIDFLEQFKEKYYVISSENDAISDGDDTNG